MKRGKRNAHQIVKRACFTLMTIKINRVRQKKPDAYKISSNNNREKQKYQMFVLFFADEYFVA